MDLFLFILLSYLIGSIPFSHIFPKLKGKDVREAGTKNVGATNALVVAGPIFGALALIGDVGKGYLCAYLAGQYLGTPWAMTLAGLAAIAGHVFSIFLRFRGGKGIATMGGVLLAIDPFFAIIALSLWILLIVVTRYFILSTLIISGSIPIMMFVVGKRHEFIIFGVLAFALVLYTHRDDIMRLVSGRELKTSQAMKKYL
ncbi:MAG: glycerol-3-phosphate 1-O-acyltransferase PlsY [Candidatus Margulisiibacteriota bacterium]|nr:glycerol-3-phosphate 1-O-acyltransferase PlsY [Candidatus Margulisiibacteriota bacterium]